MIYEMDAAGANSSISIILGHLAEVAVFMSDLLFNTPTQHLLSLILFWTLCRLPVLW